MPAIPLLPSSFIPYPAEPSTPEPQLHSSFKHDAVFAEANSILWTESSSQSIVRWDKLLRMVSVVVIAFLVLAVLSWVTHSIGRARHSESNEGVIAPDTETSRLFGTKFSSSTTLYDNYRACQSITTTAVHTPECSPRGSTKPVLQPVTPSEHILGECHDYIASPVENTQFLLEPPTMVVAQPLGHGTRGKASAVTQGGESIDCNGFDRGAVKPQLHIHDNQPSHEVSKVRTQVPGISSNTSSNRTNGPRAQTAPCVKTRSGSLAKSLTRLASIRQTTVHILAVGMSWEGIEGGPHALPGPLHDIEWLRNVFAQQKNFRFNSLLDHAATLVTIRQSLEDMLSVAGENDLLVLYFSGHGGQNDSFELYDSASLNDVILNEWIVKFRSTTPRSSPVYIIFDFCRPDKVNPNTELAAGVNVIWACSPTESALDLRLKDPNNYLPRSCFLLSLVLAIDDTSEDPTAPVVARFTNRMKEFVRVIRGLPCFKEKCRLPWRCCQCEICLDGKLCVHDKHKGDLPFQVVSIGGIGANSDLSSIVQFVASRFPLHIKRAANLVSRDHWVLYFNPSYISANKRPLNPRNRRLGVNSGIETTTIRNMTIPVNLIRF
ncbi:hypothetical protein OPQ81_001857 [Rhizoctonia solani]|nr:hypothetical protein OPQ81_001857 [Rhizoctonia solani]